VGGSSDANTLTTDSSDLDGDTVQGNITKVHGDLATRQNLGPTPSTNASAALAAGQKALADSNNVISWANGQASTIICEANQLSSQAQSYANAHSR
jgi:hypothetical protein